MAEEDVLLAANVEAAEEFVGVLEAGYQLLDLVGLDLKETKRGLVRLR